MKVALEKTYPLQVPAATAWRFLKDVERVAECMPGAKITGKLDETRYQGAVTVRVGPATASFKGVLEVKSLDDTRRELKMQGKGSDTGGTSSATMDLTAWIKETGPASCELAGKSEVTVTGKLATFGGRMMNTVSDQLLKQFFANFETQVAALHAARPGEAAPAQTAGELNALALVWAIIRDFFRNLFGGKQRIK